MHSISKMDRHEIYFAVPIGTDGNNLCHFPGVFLLLWCLTTLTKLTLLLRSSRAYSGVFLNGTIPFVFPNFSARARNPLMPMTRYSGLLALSTSNVLGSYLLHTVLAILHIKFFTIEYCTDSDSGLFYTAFEGLSGINRSPVDNNDP